MAEMQVRKTYRDINPELLHDQVRDFVQKYGPVLDKAHLQTYSLPGASAHMVRSKLTFKIKAKQEQAEKECIRVHIIGSAVGETKMMLDIDDEFFPQAKVSALEEDLDFIFGSFEVKPPKK